MNARTNIVFSIIAIAAAVLLFAAGPIVATHQAHAFGGWGGCGGWGWGGGCGGWGWGGGCGGCGWGGCGGCGWGGWGW
jgi:hypothetical protein